MRAVIYARFSSDNQREASIADQIEVCRRTIEQQGWIFTKAYEDRAVSGASRFRTGYQQLLADAERHAFDIVVCEALDRLGRKLADIASLHDQLSYLGIKIHTASTGEVLPIHIGMLGTMAQIYLSDLREKTKRGQLGRALLGKIPGGLAYGYDIVPPDEAAKMVERGERQVNATEAVVVRRIFEEFANGRSPRAIAKTLNNEGVSGPGGRSWCDTTIRGQVDRGTGILNNALYVGRLEWNRCSYVKNPKTGKRVARINPRETWEVVEVPKLRIVSDDLWNRVKARQADVRIEIGRDETGNALNRAHRRQFLLSGLLSCGECGSSYTIVGKDRYGCATHRSKGTCSNNRGIKRQDIEHRVLAGLKDKLMAPELVAEFVAEFQREMNRMGREAEQRLAEHRRELNAIERKIEAVLRAVEDGMYHPTMKARLTALEARKVELGSELAAGASPTVLRVHPKLPEIYRDKVARLEAALADEATKSEAMELIRGLIDKIVLTPAEDGLKAELYGDLAEILAFSEGAKSQHPSRAEGCQLSVVAGARNQRCLHLDHAAL